MNTTRLWILGAADPEMQAIETLLRESGESVAYAVGLDGQRVHPGNAYRAECPAGATHVVECCDMIPPGVVRIDHHRPGDPGYGMPPEQFLEASSIGQVYAVIVATVPSGHEELVHRGYGLGFVGGHPRPGRPGKWYRENDQWIVERVWGGHIVIDPTIVLTAAADHCLESAYRGRCPGVDPDALMRWRAESRAAFQKRPVADVLADIEAARQRLREAPTVQLGGVVGCTSRGTGDCYCDCCTAESHCGDGHYCDIREGAYGHGTDEWARDLRGHKIPELPEASAREGICFIAVGLPDRDGRVKVVCQSGRPEQISQFMEEWAPAHGLVDVYGDPARGFAGGYIK